MPRVEVLGAGGESVGEVELDAGVFGAEVRDDLVHAAVVAQLAAKRAGTHQAKTRGEVRGGGRKPYRQKGTGRARQGSRIGPHQRGGGVAHPPRPKDWSLSLPRKVRRQALRSAWSQHVAAGSLLVLEALTAPEQKTREVAAQLREALSAHAAATAAALTLPERDEDDSRPPRRAKSRQRLLLLLGPDDELALALRNLSELELRPAERCTVQYVIQRNTAPYASVYDLALADLVVLTRSALARVTAEFGDGA